MKVTKCGMNRTSSTGTNVTQGFTLIASICPEKRSWRPSRWRKVNKTKPSNHYTDLHCISCRLKAVWNPSTTSIPPRGKCHLWRLCGDLDALLEDGDGEVRVGRGAQPQSEVRVGVRGLQLLHQLVQLRHPAQRQVAVGKEHPVPLQTATRPCCLATRNSLKQLREWWEHVEHQLPSKELQCQTVRERWQHMEHQLPSKELQCQKTKQKLTAHRTPVTK